MAALMIIATAACSKDETTPENPDENGIQSDENETDTDGNTTDENTTDENTTDENTTDENGSTYELGTGFARGADISWCTQMESENFVTFRYYDNTAGDIFDICRDIGFNAIRLRVWVDPEDGWCGKEDVIAKAKRAAAVNARIMIDFHYSDTWADPGAQYMPAAWEDYTALAQVEQALTDHTVDILDALKDEGIYPEWVQVGNEVRSGMLWSTNANVTGATWAVSLDGVTYPYSYDNFKAYINTGYAAVKSVFPDAKVVVHIDGGENSNYTTWIFGGVLKGANYDVIGLSLYPTDNDDYKYNDKPALDIVGDCVSNIKSAISSYGKEVILCEVGMPQSPVSDAQEALEKIVTECKAIDNCGGVFYWEPEACNGWQGYVKGAFYYNGRPTEALYAFAADDDSDE